MRHSASGSGHVPTGLMPLDDQELFQVPMVRVLPFARLTALVEPLGGIPVP